MLSTRPYLFKAFYEWIIDNGFTPHVVINADILGVSVPKEHVENGQIVLNIAPDAVKDFSFDKKVLSFDARFSGVTHSIHAPIAAIAAIYAKENGQGIVFSEEMNEFGETSEEEASTESAAESDDSGSESEGTEDGSQKKDRSHLKIIK